MELRIFPSKLQEKITQRHCLSYDIWGKSIESHSNDKAIELTEIRDSQSTLEVAVRTRLAFYEMAAMDKILLEFNCVLSIQVDSAIF